MKLSRSLRLSRFTLASIAALGLAGCQARDSQVTGPPPTKSEGTSSDLLSTTPSFGEPFAELSAADLARFAAGKVEFQAVETVAEGLGPVFNEASCASCHSGPVGGTNFRLETRFGRTRANGTFDPMTEFGGSLLQDRGIGFVSTLAGTHTFNGEVVPAQATVIARRLTTPLFGLGLVDAVPDEELLRLAQIEAESDPETGGTPNLVREIRTNRTRVGRFGWKAQVPTLFQFSGDAYLNEMGITSPEFPSENCPQGDCAALKFNPFPALNDDGTAVVKFTDFMTLLAPPPRGPNAGEESDGTELFASVGCSACHTPTLKTGESPVEVLSHKRFHPFSDFLLHDMGSLGDGIEQSKATGRLMRTAPLWGVRSRSKLLHDGRATTLEAAILAHDGQGSKARDRFQALDAKAKLAFLAYLKSL